MTFRYARHTNNLQAVTEFYTDIIGLSKLGEFNSHDGYDGVFLGKPTMDWHLEFTESEHEARHTPDEDDLLVFYFDTEEEIDQIKKRMATANIPVQTSKNPYWNRRGTQVNDSDGFGVILTLKK